MAHESPYTQRSSRCSSRGNNDQRISESGEARETVHSWESSRGEATGSRSGSKSSTSVTFGGSITIEGTEASNSANSLKFDHRSGWSSINDMHRWNLGIGKSNANLNSVPLDSRQVLKAFRLIGGADGIQVGELRKAIASLRNKELREPLEKDLASLFAKSDFDKSGVIDILEFEQMLKTSTLLEAAMYELLQRDDEENVEATEFEIKDTQFSDRASFQALTISCVVLDIIVMAVAVDTSPDWRGWQFIAMAFCCVYSLELLLRCIADRVQFRHVRANLFDLCIIAVAWLDVAINFQHVEQSSISIVSKLRWARFLRFASFGRLIRVFSFFPDLVVLIYGLMLSIRAVLLGFMAIGVIVFMWAMFLRQMVAYDFVVDDSGILKETFSSVPESIIVLFRCMALNADGACIDHKTQESFFSLLATQFASKLFEIAWVASELIVQLGCWNAVIAVFVVQSINNASDIRERQRRDQSTEDHGNLQRLDKLLRHLIHPGRSNQSNPKDRHATEVAKMIRMEYPEVAAKIPDLEGGLVQFAHSILDARKIHQQAMDRHEATEMDECKKLYGTPSALTYMVDGKERLCANEDCLSNTQELPAAPRGQEEVLIMQDHDDPEVLFQEAREVQEYVKSVILPRSTWASSMGSGPSGPIWKQSNKLCDEAVDPGIKSNERLHQKVRMKYNGRYERNRDYCRLGLLYDSIRHLTSAIPRFLEFTLDTHAMQVVTIENRFVNPHPLGWRDMTLLLKVKTPSSGKVHIMELQLQLRGLKDVKSDGHTIYEEIRSNLPNTLVTTILDRLVTDTTLDLGINKTEWIQCMKNKEIKKLLTELRVPLECRKTLFDTVDIDGSGTVTSSELRETLRLFNTSVQAPELVCCHLRVQDIQQQMLTKVEPRLMMLQTSLAQQYDFLLKYVRSQTVQDEASGTRKSSHRQAQRQMSAHSRGSVTDKAPDGGMRQSQSTESMSFCL